MAGLFSRVLSALFPKQMTKEEFLAKAKDVHGNKYDYSKVRYKDEDTRVTITQKEDSEDSGLFNDEMLNDIFGLNSDDAEEQ